MTPARTPRPELLGARRTVELLERHRVRPLKRLGQNFIIDPNTIRKIIDDAGLHEGDQVLEIGAGAGALTVALARAVKHVTAVEVDERLAPVLREVTEGLDNVDVVIDDALVLDLDRVDANRLVGNLPYSIADDLALRMLSAALHIGDMTVMVQKEAAQRLTAAPGEELYGATCLQARYWAQAIVVAKVSRNAFFPAPHVDSVLLHFDRVEPRDVEWNRFSSLVRAVFVQRRKTVRNALTAALGSQAAAVAAIESSGVDPRARPEELDIDAFLSLARHSQ